ncbi:MAG: penicillin acylase family protein [Planctomycetes bacterium]|nr:penicillin acylase family protein [Planctomycetota bacterium]
MTLALGCRSTTGSVPDWAATTWIHRDGFGVPHIEAATDAGAVFGWMYARAEDEFAKIEEACFVTLGRSAEQLGEAGLPWDRLVHALSIPERAQAQYRKLPASVRELCDAAAAALNLYHSQHPERGLGLLDRFEPWHLVAQTYSWHLFQAAETLRSELGQNAALEGIGFADGSNAWAVAPSRTRAGHALLLINPHLALGEVFEGHLHSDQGLDVAGGAPYGRGLFPLYGHNQHLAWALTVNRPDVVDLIGFVCFPEKGELRYLWEGTWTRMQRRSVEVRVKLGDRLEARTLHFFDSPVGPLVAQRGPTHVALAVAGLDDNHFLETHYAMARARNLGEFQAALGLGGFLFHNVVYADDAGHIWYLYGGRIPKRRGSGPWDGVRASDGKGPVWQGYHAIAELPQVLDPACGWLQNCNSSPLVTCDGAGLHAEDYPDYLVGPEESDSRALRSTALLSLAPRMDLGTFETLAFDPFVESARTWIGEIVASWERTREHNPGRVDPLAEAIGELQAWDQRASVDSVASTLFFLWFEKYMATSQANRNAPAADRILAQVLDELELRCGTWRIPWGQINRLRRPGSLDPEAHDWPMAGGHGAAGVQATFLSHWVDPEACRREGYRGSAYVSVVELGDPVESRSIVPYGQSRDPNSPHFEDQAPLFAKGRMKANPFTPDAVHKAAVRSYHPGE